MEKKGVRALVLILVLAIALPSCAEGGKFSVPPSLGGLKLSHYLQGEQALREIDRLHGKKIRVKEGYVAHYEANGNKAMLYVSEAYLEFLAARQLESMADGIRKGNTPFFHLKESQREGMTLYSTIGLGQIHYFYRVGNKVVWLAADPTVAKQALVSVLQTLR